MRKPSFKERMRTSALNAGARVLGREMIHLDFDKLERMGVVRMGRHSAERPVVRGYYSAYDKDAHIKVGNFSGIHSSAVFVVAGLHHMDWITTFPIRDRLMGKKGADGPFGKGHIEVGSDVWIGYEALILSGVTLGHGSVVGARAVVTKDVRPYAIVAGNPAREIRRRFSDDQIEALLRIAWWEWPDEKVFELADLICGPNVDEFIERFDPARR
jgi:acetyltransferase-like isoleucine patch superfamily enzyme